LSAHPALSPDVSRETPPTVPVLRRAGESDDDAILQLFPRIFGITREGERWAWQYRASPGGPGIVSVAEVGEGGEAGAVVGCSAFMRMDLNHLGRRIPAGQACDAMVLAGWRGQGCWTALVERNHQEAEAAGWGAVFSFPNRQSFPIRVGRLGSRRIAVLRHYQRRIGARRLVGAAGDPVVKAALAGGHGLRLRAESARIGGQAEVRVTRSFPDEVEELLREHRRQEVVSVWKDREYLEWRYARHPDHTYDVHVLHVRGVPRALAVCRVGSPVLSICEVIHREHDVHETAYLLRHLARHYARTSAQSLAFYGWDCGFFDAAFAAAGFAVSPFSRLHLVARVPQGSPLTEHSAVASNWTISYGDLDAA
jgi:hypothetical protein